MKPLTLTPTDREELIRNASGLALSVADVTRGARHRELCDRLNDPATTPAEIRALADEIFSLAAAWACDAAQLAAEFALTVRAKVDVAERTSRD